jgi:uncharacterized protein YyaL (SSP411 family)
VAHWADTARTPIVFDTGQVIFGWIAAFRSTGDERYRHAATRAGDWLAASQHTSGSWKGHQHLGTEKVIDTRVSWALLELHRLTGSERCLRAATRHLDWALEQQDADGWFRNCAFTGEEDPYTHTIAYTAEGLFECGMLLEEPRYIEAARLTADALRARQYANGHLKSTYGPGWRETSASCCLTGNCQMSRLWLELFRTTGNEVYSAAAARSIRFVASTQKMGPPNPEIRGAIAGSYPIQGRYERFKYPNWAAKFFADALLTLDFIEGRASAPAYAG